MDTIQNHPLFPKQHSLDSIKQVLANDYNFQNQLETIVFVGYDNLNTDSLIRDQRVKEGKTQQKKNGGNGLGILLGIFLPAFTLYVAAPLFREKLNKTQLSRSN